MCTVYSIISHVAPWLCVQLYPPLCYLSILYTRPRELRRGGGVTFLNKTFSMGKEKGSRKAGLFHFQYIYIIPSRQFLIFSIAEPKPPGRSFFFLAGAGAVQKWIGFRRNNAKKYSPRPLLNLKSAKLYNQLKNIKNNGQL